MMSTSAISMIYMYSPEYSLQWIYEDIMKFDIDKESRKLLEEGHKGILQSECYYKYGYIRKQGWYFLH